MADFSFMAHTASLWSRGGAGACTAATVIRTLCKNVLEKPDNLKYRRVREGGSTFSTHVAQVPGAAEVLVAAGWSRETIGGVGEYWVLHHVDTQKLRAVLYELERGLSTATKLRAARATAEAPPSQASSQASLPSAAAAPTDVLTQLRARAAVHRVAARQSARRCTPVDFLCRAVALWLAAAVAVHGWRERSKLLCAVLCAAGLPPPPLHNAPGAAGASATALALAAGLVAVVASRRNSWRPNAAPSETPCEAAGDRGPETSADTQARWSGGLGRLASCSGGIVLPLPRTLAVYGLLSLIFSMGAALLAEEACVPGAAVRKDWELSRARLAIDLPACGATPAQVAAAFRAAALSQHPDKRARDAAVSLAALLRSVLLLQGRLADVAAEAAAIARHGEGSTAAQAAAAARFGASREAAELLRREGDADDS